MALVSVNSVLNQIKMDDLETLEPFYLTQIRREMGERGRKASEDDAMGEMYSFALCNTDGEIFAHAKTATLAIMGQIDEFLTLGTPDDVYGPVKVAKVGKTRRFVAVAGNPL